MRENAQAVCQSAWNGYRCGELLEEELGKLRHAAQLRQHTTTDSSRSEVRGNGGEWTGAQSAISNGGRIFAVGGVLSGRRTQRTRTSLAVTFEMTGRHGSRRLACQQQHPHDASVAR